MVTTVLGTWNAHQSESEIAMLTQAIHRQGYSSEELTFALDRLSVDPELDKKLSFPNSRITAADFERHVSRLRKLKAKCRPTAKLSRFDVSKIIDEFSDLVSWDNFGVCGFTASDEPLYRFSNDKLQKLEPSPTIQDEKPLIRSRDDSTGLVKIGEALK